MHQKERLYIDWLLLLPVFFLFTLGALTLFSIHPDFLKSQLFALVISLAAFFFFSQLQYKSLSSFAMPIYCVSMVSFLLVLFFGIESRGSVRWLDFFGIRIQFSEIAKPFLLLSLATILSSGRQTFRKFFTILVLLVPLAFAIFKQPDLGNALIYSFVTVATLLVTGFPLLWFFLCFVGLASVSPIIWEFLHDYQRQRVLTFINPANDPLGTSYNSIQAIIAVGSGKLFGKGIGEGTQSVLRFLPERQTDFIFATLSEQFGFIAACIVLTSFGFLLYRMYTISTSSEDTFSRIFAIGAFSLIFVQFFFNIGMNIGILPVVGITLPFVSFGGSSLLSNFILLGILSSIGNTYKIRKVLEIR